MSTSSGGVGGPAGAAEERVAHRCAWRDAERVGEDRGWCLADEFAPCGQPARPGRDAKLVKDADEPAVAAVFAGELPGKQPRRGRVGCRGTEECRRGESRSDWPCLAPLSLG
jgi:hypothetical protein